MEGMSLEGYDNATEEFTSIWIDNFGTGISVAKGKYDEETKVLDYHGSMVDPITKKDIHFKETITFNNENSYVLKIFINFKEEEEFKSMQIEFTRVKK